jgi:hypothetical protein
MSNDTVAAADRFAVYEDHIRRLAYRLWEAAGRPDGRDDEFWHRAVAGEASAHRHLSEAARELLDQEVP